MNRLFDQFEQPEEIFASYTSSKSKDTHKMFSVEEPEFDTSTYLGRFRRNRQICNPFIAFYSN